MFLGLHSFGQRSRRSFLECVESAGPIHPIRVVSDPSVPITMGTICIFVRRDGENSLLWPICPCLANYFFIPGQHKNKILALHFETILAVH